MHEKIMEEKEDRESFKKGELVALIIVIGLMMIAMFGFCFSVQTRWENFDNNFDYERGTQIW